MKMLKILGIFTILLIAGCSNLFDGYKTVYRIGSKTGQIYYSNKAPKLKEKGIYIFKDLDGNTNKIKQNLVYKIEKYKHK